jgi:cysteine desulfurase
MDMIIERLGSLGGFTTIPESRTLSDSRFSPWIIQISNSSIPGEVLVRSLSAYDISISTGSACSSRKTSRPVLDAMRVPKNIQQNAFRLSIGPTTDESDIEQLYHALKEICRRL